MDSPGKCTANIGGTDVTEESETIEKEVQREIEAGQTVMKTILCKKVNKSRPVSVNMTTATTSSLPSSIS